MPDLEQLKQKYQPAFRVMEQLHVRLQNVNMQGDKLFVRAEAPSQDAKNKAWDQIKAFLKPAGDIAKKHDIVIGIEFLRHQESNIINTGADVTFPLYGWYFQGEPPVNGLPDVNLGDIDQLNAIIQRSLAAPAPPPIIGEGGGNAGLRAQ